MRTLASHLRTNAIAYVALTLALGMGTAWAAGAVITSKKVRNGTLISKDLKDGKGVRGKDVADGSLGSADIGDGAVASAEVADGSIGSAEVADGSLAGVDLGADSVSASHVGTDALGGADIDESTLSGVLECPAGLTATEDVCFTDARSGDWVTAAKDCVEEGLRLPEIGEAMLVERALPGIDKLWTTEVVASTDLVATTETNGVVEVTLVPFNSTQAYRCVTAPRG